MTRRALSSRLAHEEGGVLVMVAFSFAALFMMVAFVANVGDWFAHKRHLQLQADAAAFAGGGLFSLCADGFTAGNAAITDAARAYSGDPTYSSANPLLPYNQQVNNAGDRVHVLLNSKTYYSGGPGPDDTVEDDPCQAAMVDVKISEVNLPWLLGLPASLVPRINAHARYVAKQAIQLGGAIPLALTDVRPKNVSITYVKESGAGTLTCTPSCTVPLTGPTIVSGYNVWTAPAGYSIDIPSGGSMNVGIRTTVDGVTYDTGSANGLAMIRGYDPTTPSGAQPASPQPRAVWTSSATCGSPAMFAGPCDIAVKAVVDFGTGNTDPTLPKANGGVRAVLTATMGGVTRPMTYDGTTHSWSTAAGAFSVPADGGPRTIDLNWEEHDGGPLTGQTKTCDQSGAKCDGIFTNVQRVFSATTTTTRSGPVQMITAAENVGSPPQGSPFSLAAGSHELVVSVGLSPNRALNPAQNVELRFTDDQNGAINCGGGNFRDELVNGCTTAYAIHPEHPDVCDTVRDTRTPPDCVQTFSGIKAGQLRQGMDDRLGRPCTPNNWPNYPNIEPGDKRIVFIIVTDYDSFDVSGTHYVPVRDYASFYVTGWDYENGFAGCADNEAPPAGSVPCSGNCARVWGHFFKYTGPPPPGSVGGGVCSFDPGSLTPCLAYLDY